MTVKTTLYMCTRQKPILMQRNHAFCASLIFMYTLLHVFCKIFNSMRDFENMKSQDKPVLNNANNKS